ncbi:MAG: sigma-70 family RNA polymerase sigma factor [Planctomycetota bacterium]
MRLGPGDSISDSDAAEDVVAAAAAGDPEAWKSLVGLWSRRVYAAAQSRLRDPEAAEEVVQSVMVTVYEHISSGKYAHKGQFESWLFRIAMNRVRDVVRRSQRQRTRSLTLATEGVHASDPPPAAAAEDAATQALRLAIESLPEADREVLSLRHHAQLGFSAIAELLGQPVGTVLARHHRALAKLRVQLESQSRSAEVGS